MHHNCETMNMAEQEATNKSLGASFCLRKEYVSLDK